MPRCVSPRIGLLTSQCINKIKVLRGDTQHGITTENEQTKILNSLVYQHRPGIKAKRNTTNGV